MKVKELIKHVEELNIDESFKNNFEWSKDEQQEYIYSVLNGESNDLILMNYDSQDGRYYVLEGQQNLNCLLSFVDNDLSLEDEQHFSNLSFQDKKDFLNYDLDCRIVKDGDHIRLKQIILEYEA